MPEQCIPLHPAQQDVYMDQLLNIDSPEYNIGGYIVLKGNLDRKKFHEAVNSAPRIFDAFKMRFDLAASDLLCHYANDYHKAELAELDFSDRADPGQYARDWMQSRFGMPFQLKKGTLPFEQFLIKINDQEHWFFGKYHHLITDGYGFIIYVQYVGRKYTALLTGLESSFNYPQYQEAATNANQYYHSANYREDGIYWKDKISVKPEKLLQKKYALYNKGKIGTTYSLSLSEEQRSHLEEIQKITNTGLQQLTIAALLIYFGKISTSSEIIFGTPTHKRGSRQLRNTVGMFSGILPFKGNYNKDQTLADLLKDIAGLQRNSFRHQNYLIGDLCRELKINTSEGYLCEVLVNYEHLDFELGFGEEIAANIVRLGNEDEHNPMHLCWRDYGKKQPLQLQIQFGYAYFSQEEIELLAQRILFIIKQFPNALNRCIESISILPPEEQVLLEGLNKIAIPYPKDKSVTDLFGEQSLQAPDAIAIIFEGQQISYKALDERSNQLAHYLHGKGVKEEMLVPLLIERGIDMLVGVLGIMKAGGAYVPIDADFPEDRISYVLEDTDATIVVSSKAASQKLPANLTLEIIELDELGATLRQQPSDKPETKLQPDHLAYVIYTSGSTGRPKGVQISHRNLVDYVYGLDNRIGIRDCSTFGLVSSIATDLGNTVLYGSLLTGGTLHVFSKDIVRNIESLHAYFEEYAIDCLKIVPSHWKALIMEGQLLLPCKLLIFGGEALNSALIEMIRMTGTACRVINHYGPTETTIGKLLHEVQAENQYGQTIPIGKPFSNTHTFILNKELSLCPIGVPGQLFISGDGLSRGYVKNNELTQEQFIPNPFDESGKSIMYGTGDRVQCQADGNIVFIGRVDDQVKVRGYRVEPGEVGRVLEASDLVDQAVVVSHEDKQGNNQLVAYVIPRRNFDRAGILEHLKQQLPEYMIPANLLELHELPLTANGKIDRKALPDPEGVLPQKKYTAPRNPTEQAMAEIWEEVLEIEDIGTDVDFFELGGHSLLAVRLVSAIRKVFGMELPISDVFDYPTVGLLAARLTEEPPGDILPPVLSIIPRPEYIPLSFSQERLWFIDCLEGSVQYNVPAVLRLQGNLRLEVLEKTLREIINRHEVLRTVILGNADGHGYQQVRAADSWSLGIIDALSNKIKTEDLSQLISGLVSKPFDLSRDYMLRADLIKLGREDHMLVVTMHHIASDAWSKSILVKEVIALYDGFAGGVKINLPPLAIQYADYAIWQRTYMDGKLLESKLDYWKAQLDGVTSLELPADYNRPPVQRLQGATVSFDIETQLNKQVQEFSHQHGVTPYMTLLTVFNVLLYRHSGQEDICVGTPIAGRNQHEIESLIGFFVNTLALRSRVRGEMSFTDLLEEVKAMTLEAYAHQDVPFEKVVDAVVKERDMSRNPLFQVLFSLQNTPEVPELKLGNLTLSDQGHEQTTTKFDLAFFIKETKDGVHGMMQYNTDLYSGDRISRMASHFRELLVSAVTSPGTSVGKLEILSKKEQSELQAFGRSTSRYPEQATVTELFEVQALRYPDRSAVVFAGKSVSYKELNGRANRLAYELQRLGVKEDTLVPLYAGPGIDMLTGILGILKAGGAYVAIDTVFPAGRISYMLEDTGAVVAVSSGEHLGRLRSLSDGRLEVVDLDSLDMTGETLANPPHVIKADHLAYVIYTSGSTGKPKGVQISHRSLVDYVYGLDARTGISECRSYALVSTIATDLGNTVLYSSLVFGGILHVFTKETVSHVEELHAYFEAHKIDCLKIVPSHWKALTMDGAPLLPDKLLIFGGEALHSPVIEMIRMSGKACRVINHYGPTETTIGKLLYEVETGKEYYRTIPIGKPFSDTRAYILDKELNLCPVGVPGQLCIAGAGIARGYLNRSDLTAEKFIKNPYGEEEERMYGTGDQVVWLPDGNIEYLGRIDDQVKIRGYRIELGEIESVLNQSGLIQQGVVLAKEDSGGNKRLVGYAIPQGTFDKQALQEYLNTKLPEYMVPAIWVELERIPLTPNGKIDRKGLPDPEIKDMAKEYASPRTEIEQALAGIWQELLGLERVGIYDNFFELGGDSILTIQVVSRMRRAGYVMQPKDIFNHQSIAGLSAALDRSAENGLSGEQGILSGSFGLTPIQSWYLEKERADASHYNQSVVLKISKSVPAAVLVSALEQLRLHHDALRMQYKKREGLWEQEYGAAPSELDVEDMRDVPGENLAEMISARSDKYQRSLSIEQGVLMRMVLMQTPAQEESNRLLMVVHHLAVDGVSWRIIVEDLEQLLDGLMRGRQVSLGSKSSSYRQWHSALEQYGGSRKLQRQKEYWERAASSYAPLPEDKEYAGEVLRKDMEDCQVRLGAEQTRYLLQEVPSAYHTEVNDLLLGALSASLCGWSGKSSVVIGLEGHGREAVSAEIDSSRTVGWFTSLCPLLLKGSSDAGTLIKEVKEELRRVPDKGLGYGVLKYINKAVGLQGRDPWDLVFNYLGQLDTAVGSGSWLSAAGESSGKDASEAQVSGSKLSVSGQISGGELVLRWSYSARHYNHETISKLAGDYIGQLRRLISHCLEQAGSGLVYTPSDYGLSAEVTCQELDRFLEGPYEEKKIKDQAEDICRLSGLQQGMLFHSLYDEGSGDYIEQLGCDLIGVNLEALLASWSAVIRRHSILRSAFYYDIFNVPVQCVYRDVKLPVAELDYRGMDQAAQASALREYEAADRARGFDFKSAPLMRLGLIRLEDDRYRMLWTSHHLLFDGWSRPVLVEEFLNTYDLLVSGQALPAAEEDRYGDYIRYLERRDKDAEEHYWRNYLQGINHGTLLPFIRTAAERTKGGGTYGSLSLRLDEAAIARVQGYAQSKRLTVNSLMQGIWALLLHKYTDNAEVLYGVVVSGRPDELPGVEQRVGMYINTLAFKAEFGGDQETVSWLQGVQADQVSSRQYQYTALQDVQGWTGIKGDLFDSILVFENYPVSKLIRSKAWSLQVENIAVAEQTNYPLTIIIESTAELNIRFNYNADLLEQAYVTAVRDQFDQVLRQITDGQADTLNDIRILTKEQEHTLLIDFNATETAYPKNKSIADLFEDQVIKNPEAIAIVLKKDQLTYKELNERSNRLARYLQKKGVSKEMLVPICMERSIEMVVGILGILKAGGVYVPVDPEYPQDRISYMLEDTGAKLVLSSTASREKLNGTTAAQVIELEGDWEQIKKEKASNLQTSIDPGQLAYVIYTSGSTGKPKGVLIEHQNVVRLFKTEPQLYDFNDQDVWTMFHSFCFDFSVWEMYGALFYGGKLIIVPKDITRDALLFSELLLKEKVTVLNQTPSAFYNLQDAFLEKAIKTTPIRYVIFGGEALNPVKLKYWKQAYPDCHLVNMYGITETTVHVTYREIEWNDIQGDQSIIGKPIPTLSIYILNKEKALVPVGIAGELHIGGAGLARGYLNRPELTAERFIKDPFSNETGLRLYKTGDLGKWLPDGNIEYLGRIDDQVKIRGYRIELGEIESVLNQSGLIQQGVVLAKEDSGGNKRLVGYAIPQGTFDKQALQEYLNTKLPEYMVPAIWVELERIPLTPNGKIDRKALPDPEIKDMAKEYASPRTEIEQALAGIWQELLGLERVGIYDNFFELGGDSILTIQVVSRMRRAGYVMQPKDIFNHQSIAGLSAALDRSAENGLSGEQGILSGSFGLTPIQSWYLEKERADASHYNQSVVLKISKSVPAAVLVSALEQLRLHHDALRMQYKKREGLWEQEYGAAPSELDVEDMRDVPGENLAEMISARSDKYQRSLSIEQGVLMRMVLMQTPAQEESNRLLMVVHHLAVDGVSWRIIVEDLEQLLDGLMRGRQVSLGSKSSSYRQWHSALEQYGGSRKLQRQKEYWEQVVNSYVSLPGNHAYNGTVRIKDMGHYRVNLGAEQTRQLLQEIPKVYHTEINDLLLSALAVALCKWSGNSQVLVGLEGHGREHISAGIDSSHTVGWFTSLYPVLLKAGDNDDSLIKGVKEALRKIPDKGLGYGVLKYINKAVGLQGSDPWDIVFNYLGQLDTAVRSGGWLSAAGERSGTAVSDAHVSASKLSVSSSILAGQLILDWSYSGKHYSRETIGKLAEDYIGQLIRLINHCLEQGESGAIATPSDYGLGTEITYQELDRFLQEDNDENILSF